MSERILDNIGELADQCHQVAVDCGWWTDLTTGERIIRDRGTLLMLCVSEVSEAIEAWEMRAMDDKLTGRRGVEVELADLLIRVLDFIPGLGYRDEFVDATGLLTRQNVPFFGSDGGPPGPARFLGIIRHLAVAMEYDRKNQPSKRFPHLPGLVVHTAQSVRATLRLGSLLGVNLYDAMQEKLAYNRTRWDHKIEARRAAGGKAY